MHSLLRVTRENVGGSVALYLYYQNDVEAARTIEVNDAISVDVDAAGQTIGVEMISPRGSDLETLTTLAHERELSLDGLFSYA